MAREPTLLTRPILSALSSNLPYLRSPREPPPDGQRPQEAASLKRKVLSATRRSRKAAQLRQEINRRRRFFARCARDSGTQYAS